MAWPHRILLGLAVVAAVSTFFVPSGPSMMFHAAGVATVATVWLGVLAWRMTGGFLGVISGAGGALVITTWLWSQAVSQISLFNVPDTTIYLASALSIALIFLCFLPKVHQERRVSLDAFSLRSAIDGALLTTAVVLVILPPALTMEVSAHRLFFTAAAILFSAAAIGRTDRAKPESVIRSIFAIVLVTGTLLCVFSPDNDLLTVIGWALWNAGMLGQAWTLQVYEPHVPNAQRVFEADNVIPSLSALTSMAFIIFMYRTDFSRWLDLAFALWTMLLLGVRFGVSRWAENTVLRQVRNLVYTDPLTGIGNRRALLERLEHGPGWVMTLDLDSFKSINDQFGHEAGDVVLVRFVQRIVEVLPKHADFYRIAGDEFAVVMPSNVRHIKALSGQLVRCGSDPHHSEVSVSVGLAPFRTTDTPAGALRGSDIALQEAKRLGKNRAAVLDETMLQDRMRELAIASRLRSGGLEDIYVVYQPLVAMGWQGRPVVGVEALARWTDRELGAVPPGEFVPVAERQGMIPELGLAVLRQALEQLRVWVNEGRPIQISINVSVLQLRDSAVVAQMERLLAVEPELARWIIMEVTETVFTDDDRAVNALRQLRSLGLCTALDDFGTGASTLTRLRHLPIDILKIDRSLVSGAGTDPSADAILDMVATLGRRMEMVLVAEGLEDETATDRCAQLGYAVGQGFVFSQPVPGNMLPPFALLERPAMPRRRMVDTLWTQAAIAEAAGHEANQVQHTSQRNAGLQGSPR